MEYLLKKESILFWLASIFTVLVSSSTILSIKVKEFLFNAIVQSNMEISIFVYVFIVFCVVFIIRASQTFLKEHYISLVRSNLQLKIINNLFRLNKHKRDTYNLDTLLNNDIQLLIDQYYNQKLRLVAIISTSLLCYIYCMTINYLVAFYALTMMVITYTVSKLLGAKMSAYQDRYVDKLGSLLNKVENLSNNILAIKTFSLNNEINAEYDKQMNNLKSIEKKKGTYRSFVNTIQGIIYAIQKVGIITIGGYFFYQNQINIGELAAIVFLSSLMSMPIINITQCIVSIKSVILVKKRIDELASYEEDELIDISKMESLDLIIDEVKIDNASILKNLSVSIKKGKKYLVVGKSGSGKSTLLNSIIGNLENEYSLKIDNKIVNGS